MFKEWRQRRASERRLDAHRRVESLTSQLRSDGSARWESTREQLGSRGVDVGRSVLVALFEPEEAEQWADGGFLLTQNGSLFYFRVEFDNREKSHGARLAEWSEDVRDFGVDELADEVAAGREILADS